MQIKLQYHINQNQSESYFEIPFNIDIEVEKFTVSYCYPKNGVDQNSVNVVDFGINDNSKKLVGWAGSARESVTVGESYSSDGFAVLPISKGEWSIIVGAYKIAHEGCDVEFVVDLIPKIPRYFFGDLHVHTTASDGELTLEEIVELARAKSLDFLAITDHNSYSQSEKLPNLPDLSFIKGVEWTHYLGHINMFGVENPFEESFVAQNSDQAKKILDFAKKSGALISANHPTDPACPLKWDFDYDFDLIEVTNGPVRPSNITALKMWDDMLKSGKIVYAVGGSDFHNHHGAPTLANPTTAIFAKSNSSRDLFDALKAGHCLVTDKKGGIMLELSCMDKMAGDIVSLTQNTTQNVKDNSASEKSTSKSNQSECEIVDTTDKNSNLPSVEICVVAQNVPEKYFLALFTEQGEIYRTTATTKNQTLKATVKKNTAGYLRAIVATSAGFLMPVIPITISNPIFVRA